MSKQNIYDDPTFFSGYKHLRDTDAGLNGALEVPAMTELLPPLRGLDILDAGCGFGDFARAARAQGARSVTAIDISERMLSEARASTTDPAIGYVQASVEDFDFGVHRWDLVVASLVLHYVEDYRSAVRRIAAGLRDGGTLAFSVEHPLCTAHPVGWVRDEEGRKLHWPVDRYAEEGARETHWFVDGVVKFHRTVSTYLSELVAAGLTIERLVEPLPTAEARLARPALEADCRRPPFLLLRARKS